MRMIITYFRILFCSAIFSSAILTADVQQAYNDSGMVYSRGQCSCGCTCAADCKCGCEDNGNCDCMRNEGACSCGSAYSDYCQCGCMYGGVCCCGSAEWGGEQYLEPYPCVPHLFYENVDCRDAHCYGFTGVWLPEDPPLFRPFIADPRQLTYSVGWRFNDHVLVQNVIDVSFGDCLPLYRFCGIWPWNGDLEFDVEGGLWAVFDPLHDSSPLINADYYVGIPITYAIDWWQFRLRGYHVSSHIGDEFLLDHPRFRRRNPSAEFLDFFISHDFTNELRLFSGIGVVLAQDESFRTGRWYADTGLELRIPRWGFYLPWQRLYGEPIFGMYMRFHPEFKRHVDMTYVLGYEFGKTCGLCRRLRIYMEYHDGYSLEGQFAKCPTHYFSIRASYGF